MSAAEFFVLGPLEVRIGDRPVDLGTPKQRLLLGMLALEANHPVSVDRLVDQLWGDDAPSSALGSLQAYISNLRRVLEPDRSPRSRSGVLVSRAPGYQLSVDAERLDVLRFEQLVAAGTSLLAGGHPDRAARTLTEALGLWRGPVLADFGNEQFVAPAAVRLDELRRAATEDLIEARLALGQHAAVTAGLEEMVGADPLRERAWEQLILALYRCGRQADALRAYERARTALAEELGILPGPRLRRLEQAVLEQDPRLDWTGAASATGWPGARPAPTTVGVTGKEPTSGPVGRHAEMEILDSLIVGLERSRGGVLLVTGAPGVGKSTMLAELARRADGAGFRVGRGQFHEGGAAPPLRPWADALRALHAQPGALDLLATAGQAAPGLTAGAVLDAAAGQLRELIDSGPVVVTLDDLQWADELSHQLLRLVASNGELPLLLAVGVREPVAGASPELLATRDALARVPHLHRMHLSGLDREAVAELAERVAGARAAPAVADALYARTAGNPFFVAELARLLASRHALDDPEGMAGAGVPAGARDVVRRRLARLPEQAVVVLRVASVIGPRVDVRLLAAVTELPVDEVVDLLELATASSLTTESPDQPGIYLFTHDLVREAIYEAVPGMRRAGLHARAVAGLLALHGDSPAVAHEAARHAVLAIPAVGMDQALPWLLASARAAQRQLGVDLAERQLRLGIKLLDDAEPTPPRRLVRADFENRLSQMLFYLHGETTEAATLSERARRLSATEPQARLDVLLGQTTLLSLSGHIEATVETAREVIDLARRLGDRSAESDAHYYLAVLAWAGELAAARQDLDIAIALTEAGGAPSDRPHVPLPCKRALRALVSALAHDRRAALEEGREAVCLASAEGSQSWTASWTGAFALSSAAISRDAAEVDNLWDMAARPGCGLAYPDNVMDACRLWAAAARSPSPDTACLSEARARLKAAGDGLLLVPLAILEAELLMRRGDRGRACRLLCDARVHARNTGQRLWLPELDELEVAATTI